MFFPILASLLFSAPSFASVVVAEVPSEDLVAAVTDYISRGGELPAPIVEHLEGRWLVRQLDGKTLHVVNANTGFKLVWDIAPPDGVKHQVEFSLRGGAHWTRAVARIRETDFGRMLYIPTYEDTRLHEYWIPLSAVLSTQPSTFTYRVIDEAGTPKQTVAVEEKFLCQFVLAR